MISFITNKIDAFLGRGEHSTSVPVMDGPLQPNQLLEEAEGLFSANRLDNLTVADGLVYFSSGNTLMRWRGQGEVETVADYEQEITCLAASAGGALAIGLDGAGIVVRGGPHDGHMTAKLGSTPFICPTAALFVDEKTLIVASGSSEFAASKWKFDLMRGNKKGSVWKIDLSAENAQLLVPHMAYPYGLALAKDHDILVSEAWAHRVVKIERDAAHKGVTPVFVDLPGYPSRIVASEAGGYWLTVFAPRNQLVEFVLRERGYREKMMVEVHPDFWVSPYIQRADGFQEPLQNGALKLLGILKPWAPTFSYGLLVRLDDEGQPLASWHSRADGYRHGVTSVCEFQGSLVVGSKGSGEALKPDTSHTFGGDV